jgi:hypothetical protein
MYDKICVVRKKTTKSGVQKSANNISSGKSGNSPYHHSSSNLRGGKFRNPPIARNLSDLMKKRNKLVGRVQQMLIVV